MKFFWKTAVAKIEDYGQVKFEEGEGFIPYISVSPTLRPKIYKSFFEDNRDSKVDLLYARTVGLVALSIESDKYKIGFQFEPAHHIKPLAGMMQTGKIAIQDKGSDKIVSFDLTAVTQSFHHTWREQVVPDMIVASLKKQGKQPENLAAHRDNVLALLENNWMVEQE